ncbi:hypothetical protein PaG_02527 [Moesziomyces aphidis]|uniref:Uncharacterized protein n=1 Tax=Moesziomyces aphidis TaxID=84754 RepID=W3VMC7_MOEAP|nr:hypothetical protein PaG_02527 [Moesziomyces aphidis]
MCRRMQDASRIARDTWRCPHTLALAIAGGDASMERCTLRQAKKKVAEIEASMRSASRPSQHGNDARRRRSMVAARPALATACTADHVVASARSTASAGRRIASQAKVSEREKSRASAAVGCTSWADALGVFKICDDRVPQPANRARGSPRREDQTRGEMGKNQGPTRLQLSASRLFAAERRSAKKTPHGDQHRSSGNKARQPAPWCIDSAEMWWGFGIDSNMLGCACGCPASFLPPTSFRGTVVVKKFPGSETLAFVTLSRLRVGIWVVGPTHPGLAASNPTPALAALACNSPALSHDTARTIPSSSSSSTKTFNTLHKTHQSIEQLARTAHRILILHSGCALIASERPLAISARSHCDSAASTPLVVAR